MHDCNTHLSLSSLLNGHLVQEFKRARLPDYYSTNDGAQIANKFVFTLVNMKKKLQVTEKNVFGKFVA